LNSGVLEAEDWVFANIFISTFPNLFINSLIMNTRRSNVSKTNKTSLTTWSKCHAIRKKEFIN
jgi:hypothetical protein